MESSAGLVHQTTKCANHEPTARSGSFPDRQSGHSNQIRPSPRFSAPKGPLIDTIKTRLRQLPKAASAVSAGSSKRQAAHRPQRTQRAQRITLLPPTAWLGSDLRLGQPAFFALFAVISSLLIY